MCYILLVFYCNTGMPLLGGDEADDYCRGGVAALCGDEDRKEWGACSKKMHWAGGHVV
jgi:hypothetical protein